MFLGFCFCFPYWENENGSGGGGGGDPLSRSSSVSLHKFCTFQVGDSSWRQRAAKFPFCLTANINPKGSFHQIITFYRGGQASTAFHEMEKEKGP